MATTGRNDGLELFIDRTQIQQRVEGLGAEISRDFAGESILLVGVLKGAAIFLADLARAISIDCTFDFVAVSSYVDATSTSGTVRLFKDLNGPVEGKNIILVEDILDTGVTLEWIRSLLMARIPACLKIAALLDKPERRQRPIQADYVGFTIPNRFVVGYGLDIAERYRNLPDIYAMPLEPEQE